MFVCADELGVGGGGGVARRYQEVALATSGLTYLQRHQI